MRAFLTTERQRRRAANLEVSSLRQELTRQADIHSDLFKRNQELESQLQLSHNNLQIVEGEQAATADLLLRCQRHCASSEFWHDSPARSPHRMVFMATSL